MRLYIDAETKQPFVKVNSVTVILKNKKRLKLTWSNSDQKTHNGKFESHARNVYITHFDKGFRHTKNGNGRLSMLNEFSDILIHTKCKDGSKDESFVCTNLAVSDEDQWLQLIEEEV